MAWNQPGGGGNKDPWNSGSGGGGGGGGQGPDVEAFLNKLKANLGRVFGTGGGGSGDRRGNGGQGGPNFGLIIVGLVVLWFALDAWVLVDERQRGVVLRFGEFDRIMPPGPNFKLPRPLESVSKIDVTQINSHNDQVRMLTADENIVQIEFNVQYLIADPEKYLFGARDPDDTLKQAAESAVRDVVGTSTMDAILSVERAPMAADARQRLQKTLDAYQTGLQVSVFNLQNARPPSEVREAFDDAISAREDRERIESEAEAYDSKVVPEARGEAARIRADAEGYKASMIAKAEGDTQRFELLAEQYRKAPEVTRQRLYLETMQQVLAGNRKIYAGDGGNVLYLQPEGSAADGRNDRSGSGVLQALPPAVSAATLDDPRRTTRTPREEARR